MKTKIIAATTINAVVWSVMAAISATLPKDTVIRKILDHLGLWDVPKRQPKRGREPPVVGAEEPLLVYADSQVTEYEEAYYIPEYLS